MIQKRHIIFSLLAQVQVAFQNTAVKNKSNRNFKHINQALKGAFLLVTSPRS